MFYRNINGDLNFVSIGLTKQLLIRKLLEILLENYYSLPASFSN